MRHSFVRLWLALLHVKINSKLAPANILLLKRKHIKITRMFDKRESAESLAPRPCLLIIQVGRLPVPPVL